jgi:hypothetical protein
MEHATLWSHRTVLAADVASAAEAREFVGLHLLEHDALSIVEDVRLVASELATLAIVHTPSAITVTLVGVDESVILTVRHGPPAAALGRATPAPPPAALGTHPAAQGLAVVRLVSRDCGVNVDPDGVESVWASFDVPPVDG